jgi:hypothetical protein
VFYSRVALTRDLISLCVVAERGKGGGEGEEANGSGSQIFSLNTVCFSFINACSSCAIWIYFKIVFIVLLSGSLLSTPKAYTQSCSTWQFLLVLCLQCRNVLWIFLCTNERCFEWSFECLHDLKLFRKFMILSRMHINFSAFSFYFFIFYLFILFLFIFFSRWGGKVYMMHVQICHC